MAFPSPVEDCDVLVPRARPRQFRSGFRGRSERLNAPTLSPDRRDREPIGPPHRSPRHATARGPLARSRSTPDGWRPSPPGSTLPVDETSVESSRGTARQPGKQRPNGPPRASATACRTTRPPPPVHADEPARRRGTPRPPARTSRRNGLMASTSSTHRHPHRPHLPQVAAPTRGSVRGPLRRVPEAVRASSTQSGRSRSPPGSRPRPRSPPARGAAPGAPRSLKTTVPSATSTPRVFPSRTVTTKVVPRTSISPSGSRITNRSAVLCGRTCTRRVPSSSSTRSTPSSRTCFHAAPALATTDPASVTGEAAAVAPAIAEGTSRRASASRDDGREGPEDRDRQRRRGDVPPRKWAMAPRRHVRAIPERAASSARAA